MLVNGTCRIENVPDISDVDSILKMVESLGAKVTKIDKNTVEIDCTSLKTYIADRDLGRVRGRDFPGNAVHQQIGDDAGIQTAGAKDDQIGLPDGIDGGLQRGGPLRDQGHMGDAAILFLSCR